MLNLKNKIIAALICLLPTITYANYTITPVKVHIKPGAMMASLSVQNNDSKPHSFQLTLYKTDGQGKVHDEESKDLTVTPTIFDVKGKKSQTVRVSIKDHEAAASHKHYVLSVKELPVGKVEANTIKIVTDFRVPILVGDEEIQAEE